MSKNVTLWGASYSDVPSIEVPSTGGGVAAFHDVSDTTAVAADVATGKYFHAADGTLTEGTSSGGGGSASDAVKFYDYDGTLLHSYSADEFSALTAMPANPTHTGLISQGWNWSLADAQAYVAEYGACNIGQMYITDDGKTRVYIELREETLSPILMFTLRGTVEIDWGDDSAIDTLAGTSLTSVQYVQHTYLSAGSYVITLTATSGEFAFYGNQSVWGLLRKSSTIHGIANTVYLYAVKKIELGNGVIVSDNAFTKCYSLVSITIPRDVANIGQSAFSACYSLSSVTIPDSVTSIVDSTFDACYSISSVTIPDSVTSIESSAFNACYALASVTIPDSVTSIGRNAFNNCNSFVSVVIPDSVTSIEMYAFSNCKSIISITTPKSVTKFNSYTFSACYALRSITIPEGTTSIGIYTCNSCYSLSSVTIPDSVTSIESGAFNACYVLASVTIPVAVTSIAANAFKQCYGLAEIHFKPTTPPTVANKNAWTNIPTDCIIYVPSGTLSAYTSATNYPSSSTYTYMEESA